MKQYVRQSGSEDMKLLFYANFGFDNLVYKTSEVNGEALTMRSTNNGEKLVEMLTLLEIMSCCGPHTFVNSSCLTTAADKDDAECAADQYIELTQDSTSSQNSGYGYVPNSPLYAPSSPHVQYSQSYAPQELTLADLVSEEETKKSKRGHRSGNRGKKWNTKKSRQGKWMKKRQYTLGKQPKKGGSRNYRRQKRKYTAKLH